MNFDFIDIFWILVLLLMFVEPVLRHKNKKEAQKKNARPSQGGIKRPSAGTSIEIPGREESFSPVKVDDTEEVKWPERNLTPTANTPGNDLTRNILAKIFGEDFMDDENPSDETADALPSSISPEEEGVCSLDSHDESLLGADSSAYNTAPAPAPAAQSGTRRGKIVDDPKKMVIYAEIMKPKYDQFDNF